MSAGGMVIIGAGECGVRAALALREQGHAGPITMVGDEPHLPYERPPLSKQLMLAETEPLPKIIADAARLEANGIRCRLRSAATSIDRSAKTVAFSDGSAIAYEKLLLATGATARRVNLPGADGRRTATLRTFDDALKIRSAFQPGARIAILGGGFIGLELAASARLRGAKVTVIEALPRILSRAVPELHATIIADRHRAEGVDLRCGAGVAAITETAAHLDITLTTGETISADLLVIGIGAVPVTGLAESAGLAIENGIAVDELLQTSDSDILAAGDCCSFPLAIYGGRRVRLESWRNAQDQGCLAARNMLGAGETISAVPWFWSDQYDLVLQIAGLPDAGATIIRRDLGNGAMVLFHVDAEERLVAASGLGRGNIVAKDIRLAEMLIAKRAAPGQAALADPAFKLRSLLVA
jgi:3-phenylpropionate/trans-cinnamate dioxygenase ferredoxin reductase component